MKIPPNCLANKIKEQLFFWTGEDVETVLKQLETLEGSLAANSDLCLFELAYSIYLENRGHKSNSCNIAIVAESINELKAKIASAKESLKAHLKFIRDSKGIYFSSNPLSKRGEIAFLFSGQGSQRPDMFKELNSLFPQMQESISKADAVLKERLPKLLSEYIYPPAYRLRAGLPSVSTPEQEKSHLPTSQQAGMEELTVTNIAQPSLGAVEAGLAKIMKLFGVNADMLAGHSLGEYVALCASGIFEEETLYDILEYRGSAIIDSGKDGNLGGMLAVGASAKEIGSVIKDLEGVYPVRNRSPLGDRTEMPKALPISNGVYIANLNSPKQTILSGDEESLDLASVKLKENGFSSKKINVSCAFHSPYMAPAKDLLFRKLSTLDYKSPVVPIYSNFTAIRYPQDKKSILSILSEHLVSPVRFTEQIENIFKDGARIFIEIGPGNVLTNLVKQILGEGKDYISIASNVKTATDTRQLLNVLAQLMAEGFNVDLVAMFEG